jgi:radical SAM protein with 4Fe4S-binding SPASM domain
MAGTSMLLHRQYSTVYPLFLKVDLSPTCNIHCATCIHANKPNDGGLLDKQHFHAAQRMALENYRKIIDEVKGKTLSVVLHYLGDPYMSPDLDEASRIAYNAGMRVHVGSNFSYKFSDERIDSIINSGVTDLTVCVDGLTQELYERTRVGGKIDLVLHNLERLCKRRKELKSKRLHIEVQYICFEHNKHEEELVRKKVLEIGVDQFTKIEGHIDNYVNGDPNYEGLAIKKTFSIKKLGFPYCHWPYTSMVIRYDGEVVPCCHHRLASQYADGIEPKTMGNVFNEGVKAVWNNTKYKEIRQQIFNTSLVTTDSFCYGCRFLFQIELKKRYIIDPICGGVKRNEF